MSSGHPLVGVCRAHGYDIEYQENFDGTLDRATSIVCFPCRTPDGVPLADDLTAIDELEVVKHLQTVWSDNAVSNTIYYRPHELEAIKAWLRDNYTHSIKTVSFLLQYDHNFKQAPYTPCSREEYEAMVARVRPITRASVGLVEDLDGSLECRGGMCPVR